MDAGDPIAAASALLQVCREKKLTVAVAESCTGGLLAATLTEIPGSSDVFDRGFVTYSDQSKEAMLDVPAFTLGSSGAVSRETAEAMAAGALSASSADLAVAITGIAGPGGALPGKPVGLVHFAAATRAGRRFHRERRFGDIGRGEVRRGAVLEAIQMLCNLASEASTRASSSEGA